MSEHPLPNGQTRGLSSSVNVEEIRQLLTVAKEATNGWACYAKREKEHREIARLHKEIYRLESLLSPPQERGAEQMHDASLRDLQPESHSGGSAPVASYVQIAERIARDAHRMQRDTVTGAPYIEHVERVVAMVEGDEAKAVAWLHDVLEDSDYTASELRRAGIPPEVLYAVEVLTRQDNATAMVVQSYDQYIDSIKASGDPLALTVKLADLRDHLHPNCPARLRPRYERAWLTLTGRRHDEASRPTGEHRPDNQSNA